MVILLVLCLLVVTPHALDTQQAQREWGKEIGVGVNKKFESYFNDRLTLSNIRSRTSRRI